MFPFTIKLFLFNHVLQKNNIGGSRYYCNNNCLRNCIRTAHGIQKFKTVAKEYQLEGIIKNHGG